MNQVVAYELLSAELATYRERPYRELCTLVGAPLSRLVRRDGVDYDITTTIQRLKKSGGDIEIHATVREADWGSPHDPIADSIIAERPQTTHLHDKPLTEQRFWGFLEYRLCREFAGMPDGKLRNYWCDGISPFKYIFDEQPPRITGFAWICQGQHQEQWQFELLLPSTVTRREDVDWASLLPAEKVTRWLAMDKATKFIQIEPAAAVPDLNPSTQGKTAKPGQ